MDRIIRESISSILLFTPLIFLIILWTYLTTEYQTNEFVTIIFTISLFLVGFMIEKLYKNKSFNIILSIIHIIIIFLLSYTIIKYPDIVSICIFPIIFVFLITTIYLIKSLFQDKLEYLEEDKYFQYNKNGNKIFEFNIFIINEDRTKWKSISNRFTNEHKKESIQLMKKNGLVEEFKLDYEDASINNILSIKHHIGLLQMFHEAIINILKSKIKKEDKEIISVEDERDNLAKLIFKTKLVHYNMAFTLGWSVLKNIIKISFILFSASLITNIFTYFLSIKLIYFKDIYSLLSGLTLLSATPVIVYLYLTFVRFYDLKIHNNKHDSWIVFIKNLFLYITAFSFTLILLMISINVLSDSGLEFNHAFHFISTMILPIITLNDIPSIMAHYLKDDVIFAIMILKIFFLLFTFFLGLLFIKHIIEIYIEKSDNEEVGRYGIPAEFARFFSYLILSVFTIILLYGIVFINYPQLNKEYETCKDYLNPSKIYLQKDKDKNIALRYCTDLTKDNNTTASAIECNRFIDYNTQYNILNKKELEITTLEKSILGANHCPILIKYYIDDNKSLSALKKSKSSLADYLPLSIFLTLFGVVMMIASRNLLENYFTGISLKINTHYEEGDRVKIDNGEMMTVKNIGFRATEFYGIKTNTHIVMPHQQLSKLTIVNYTRPTLDYREEITIYIPDRHINGRNIPKEAEKILLLSAFIATGVKKPRLLSRNTSTEIDKNSDIIEAIKIFKEHLSKQKFRENSQIIIMNNIYNDIEKIKKYLDNGEALNWNLKRNFKENIQIIKTTNLNLLQEAKDDLTKDTLNKKLNLLQEVEDKLNQDTLNKNLIEKFEKDINTRYREIDKLIYTCENAEDSLADYKKESPIYKIWELLRTNKPDEKDEKDETDETDETDESYSNRKNRLKEKLFLYKIYKLIHEMNNDVNEDNINEEEKQKKKQIRIIEKTFASILTALYDYETKAQNNLHHSVDEYCMKRKINTLYKYNTSDKLTKKSRDELKDISTDLVNISYYYFMLSKQLWELRMEDPSNHQKNNFDEASLEILDVPRVTSSHKRDFDGAFWEVKLLVTVELGEQSDEVIHHINMYIDDLWDIFDLPLRCRQDGEYTPKKKNKKH